jgi:hypothetical protein
MAIKPEKLDFRKHHNSILRFSTQVCHIIKNSWEKENPKVVKKGPKVHFQNLLIKVKFSQKLKIED